MTENRFQQPGTKSLILLIGETPFCGESNCSCGDYRIDYNSGRVYGNCSKCSTRPARDLTGEEKAFLCQTLPGYLRGQIGQ